MSIIKKILTNVKRNLYGEHQLLLGLSGGVDSVVLLHTLVQLRQEDASLSLRALYIHHGLSPNAAKWADHCRALCKQWQVEFLEQHVSVNQEKGIEAGAREARYAAFAQRLNPHEVLLTAQHLDDQCETFMLALKRGSGPQGLAAMAAKQPFMQTWQLRPLLAIARHEIESYAQHYQLKWVTDESNEDTSYDRNFLRMNVLPLLYARWPHFPHAVSRSAALCGEQEQLLDELLDEGIHQVISSDGALAILPLSSMSEVKRNAIIRRWFRYHNQLMPSRQQLKLLWQEVAQSQPDAEPQLVFSHCVVRRYQEKLYLLNPFQDVREQIYGWSLQQPLQLPDALGELRVSHAKRGVKLRAPREGESVSVRFRATGRFTLAGHNHSRPLKKIWQALEIAPWLRTRTPLIFYNETLIAALGVFVTQEGVLQEGDKPVYLSWEKVQ